MLRIILNGLAVLACSTAIGQIGDQFGVLDLTANGGINPHTGNPWAVGDKYRLVFITSTTTNATSKLASSYHTRVQQAANAAGFGSVQWRAIVCTENNQDARVNTLTRTTDANSAYFKINGVKVANNSADFWDGTHSSNINLTEYGVPYASLPSTIGGFYNQGPAWTGLNAFVNGAPHYNAWLGSTFANPTTGIGASATSTWGWNSSHNRNSLLYLYAISEPLTIISTLPIELVEFNAEEIDDDEVLVSWSTASEKNNAEFSIERSEDMTSWDILKNIPGAGNSQTVLNYSWIDRSPLNGTSYYRLKQTDFDGTYQYGPVRSIHLNRYDGSALHVYPNPTDGRVCITGVGHDQYHLVVLDRLGREMSRSITMHLQPNGSIELDLTGLEAGIYLVQMGPQSGTVVKD